MPEPDDIKPTAPLDLSAILEARPPSDPARRIYANRNLDMGSIEAVGFDMDYTVAQYHQRAMDELSVRMTVDKLIANHGYPEEIRQIPIDYDFIIRGLVVDKETGHIFKLDEHRMVGRCYHGYTPLPEEQRKALYGRKPIRFTGERYSFVDTLFSLSEITLVAGIIQHYEGQGQKLPWTYRQLFDDIRHSIDEAHADDSLKTEILADLPKYIVKDSDLGPTLHKLRSVGKRLFLLTNSEWFYTNAVMSYLLDEALPFYHSWRDYFDFVGVRARKPGFFVGREPFIELSEEGEHGEEITRYKRRGIYWGGNIQALEAMLKLSGDEILYVGDHMYGDILRSKKSGWWRTALVVQEMRESIHLTHKNMDQLKRIRQLEQAASRLDDDINYHLTLLKSLGRVQQLIVALTSPETMVIDATRERAREELNRKRELLKQTLAELEKVEAAVDHDFNRYWGRIFRERNERSWFGAQVQSYADIYTGQVSNFLAYSPGQLFRAPREDMPHERE
ncbi:MAG: HAD-IG family 5'-nucleotidase [Myxococcales bacterium]|nr:HAD-IG family 5'-nucleotidase [Myxococcales bacterium]